VTAPEARAGPLAGAKRRCRTVRRRLAAAGLACLLEYLGNEALALALASVVRGAGPVRKSWLRRSVMAVLPASASVSGRAKHADMPALARASRHKRDGGEAAA